MGNDTSKRKAAVWHVRREMEKEMDRAWEDFFKKNPGINEEEVRRRVEEWLKSRIEGKNERSL